MKMDSSKIGILTDVIVFAVVAIFATNEVNGQENNPAVWRPPTGGGDTKNYGVWWISNSGNNPPERIVGWCVYGDIPVPAFFRR